MTVVRPAAWWRLIGHGWRHGWRDGRLGPALLLLLLTLLGACWLDAQRRGAFERDRQAAEAQDEQTFAAQGARNPHSAAHFSRFAFRPMPPTMVLDPGVLDYGGAAVWMEAHLKDPPNARLAEDRADLGRLAELNVAWVFQVLAPLLLVALGFETVVRERERGTWTLLLTSGVSKARWLTAQAVALWLPLLALLLLIALLLVVIVPTDGQWDRGGRTLTWVLAHALYLAGWTWLVLWVSIRAVGSRVALVVLLGVWAVLCVAVPRLAATVANQAAPMPSATAFTAAVRRDLAQGIDGHSPAADRTKAFEQKVLTRYGVARIEDLPVSFAGLALQEGEEYGNQVYDRHFGHWADQLATQARWRRAFALLSPLPALEPLSRAAAGTDLATQLDFMQQAETARRDIVRFLNEDMIRNATGREGGARDFDYLAAPDLWTRTPRFEYQPPAWTGPAGSGWLDVALLLAWWLLPMAAAFGALRCAEAR